MPLPSLPAVIGEALRDARHGVRVLRRSPGFTTAALLTLAIGIGTTAAVFGVVRAVILEPLPYRDPDRLVAIWETNRGGTARNVIAPANFVAWRERTRTLEHLGMVGIGVAAGLLASVLLTRLLGGMLFEVEPLDPATFAATSVALLAVAALAVYFPARRGMQMAPVEALRTE